MVESRMKNHYSSLVMLYRFLLATITFGFLLASFLANADCNIEVKPTADEIQRLEYVRQKLKPETEAVSAEMKKWNLSPLEYVSIMHYTVGGYRDYWALLANETDKLKWMDRDRGALTRSADMCALTRVLIRALKKLPSYHGPVYRGEEQGLPFLTAKKGEAFSMNTLMSTSKDFEVAKHFTSVSLDPKHPAATLVLTVDHGCYDLEPIYEISRLVDGEAFSASEKEVLCVPGLAFLITRRYHDLATSSEKSEPGRPAFVDRIFAKQIY